MPGSAPNPFEYAVVRVVPRPERGECLNAGVVLICRPKRFLAARVFLDPARLAAFAADPAFDHAGVHAHLALIPQIAAGDPATGPIGRLSQTERFHWLVAPQSTMIQPSAVHTGLCVDPEAVLERLLARLVLPVAAAEVRSSAP